MKKTKRIVLDKTDKKAVKLLREIGMPKNIAGTLMYLSHVDECYSVDIENGVNLRQSEVSIAMRELRRRRCPRRYSKEKRKRQTTLYL